MGEVRMASDDLDRELKPSNVAVIREVYDSENAYAKFEAELERALEAGCAVIVVEPERLGEDTARWIRVGKALHVLALATGAATLLVGVCVRNANKALVMCVPLCCVSVLSASCLAVSWQLDPCFYYRHETDKRKLARLAALWEGGDAASGAVVLYREESAARRRCILHGVAASLAFALTIFRVYSIYK